MKSAKTILVSAIILLFGEAVLAEGTKQLMPTDTSNGWFYIRKDWSDFALYNAGENYRLYIHIEDTSEVIYYGFGIAKTKSVSIGGSSITSSYDDVVYRIKDPDGNIVVAESSTPEVSPGYIDTYAEAVAGPTPVNPSGYVPLEYKPQKTGDYYIEFDYPGTTGARGFELIDITVADTGDNAIDGRLWSRCWQVSTNGYHLPFDATMYVYSDDGIVTSLGFRDIKPFVFNVSCNSTGCKNTGNAVEDRKSTYFRYTYPQFKIFLNNPDPDVYPNGEFGALTGESYISGSPGNYCINISVNKSGNIECIIDLNGISGFQAGTKDLKKTQLVAPGWNCIPWDGLDGFGNTIPEGVEGQMEINYAKGLTHLPVFDVESSNGYIVRVVRPQVEDTIPKLFWDDSVIGGTTELTGCTNAFGCHKWECDTMINDCENFPDQTIGNGNTINTWWYAIGADEEVEDSLVIKLVYNIDANANTPEWASNDMEICSHDSVIDLKGSIGGDVAVTWSGGKGTFISEKSLETKYYFSPEELQQDSVMLYITSDSSRGTPKIIDSVKIFINDQPEIELTVGERDCENTGIAPISPQIIGNNPYTFLWNTTPVQTTEVAEVDKKGNYSVTVTDAKGCTNMETILVDSCDVIAPNVFTPGDDGINDLFIMKFLDDHPVNSIAIYNRWGSLVWESSDITPETGWDGTDKAGNNVPEGAYFYIFEYDGGRKKKGIVTVIR